MNPVHVCILHAGRGRRRRRLGYLRRFCGGHYRFCVGLLGGRHLSGIRLHLPLRTRCTTSGACADAVTDANTSAGANSDADAYTSAVADANSDADAGANTSTDTNSDADATPNAGTYPNLPTFTPHFYQHLGEKKKRRLRDTERRLRAALRHSRRRPRRVRVPARLFPLAN